jgi:hypothetical protein
MCTWPIVFILLLLLEISVQSDWHSADRCIFLTTVTLCQVGQLPLLAILFFLGVQTGWQSADICNGLTALSLW